MRKLGWMVGLGLLVATGCGLRAGDCAGGSPYPDDYCEPFDPFETYESYESYESFGAPKDAVSLKCSYAPFFCCDTCSDDEGCLSWCIEREEQ